MEEGRTNATSFDPSVQWELKGRLNLAARDATNRSIDVSDLLDAAFIVTAQDFDDQRKERTIGTTDTKNDDRKNTDKKQHTYIEKECKLASCFVN
jgi:hypothetical protein